MLNGIAAICYILGLLQGLRCVFSRWVPVVSALPFFSSSWLLPIFMPRKMSRKKTKAHPLLASKVLQYPQPCPCGSLMPYSGCCGAFHEGRSAPTPEALMRSRYSAYVLGLLPYILATWDPETRPARMEPDPVPVHWLGLEIHEVSPVTAGWGEVEFTARYKSGGRAGRLHERSRFRCEAEKWYYVEGTFLGA